PPARGALRPAQPSPGARGPARLAGLKRAGRRGPRRAEAANPLSANRGLPRVEASAVTAKVADVNDYSPTPLSPQMNGGAGYGLDDHIYQRLLKERIIFLGSEVRDQNANAICAQLLLLSAEDPKADIFLHINSPGGSVDAGMAIYD